MITVGIVKESFFISSSFNEKIGISIQRLGSGKPIYLTITPHGQLTVVYQDQTIWEETIDGPVSMFGVESCDSISRIIACIDNKTDWSQYLWKESLDLVPKPS